MATRSSGTYNVPYDPREWAQSSRRASVALNTQESAMRVAGEISGPPPPYTGPLPREATACLSSGSTISPADSTFTSTNRSPTTTPTSTAGLASPLHNNTAHCASTAGLSLGVSHAANPRAADWLDGNGMSRSQRPDGRPSSSLGHVTRPMSTMGLSIDTAVAQHGWTTASFREPTFARNSLPGPPAVRRAVSAGAVSHESSSRPASTSSSSSSRQRTWQPGMPLPGPPPGPPPPSSRSHSRGEAPPSGSSQLTSTVPTSRSQYRSTLRAPLLSPMPPTPANWDDGSASSVNARPPIALQIQTNNLDRPASLPLGLNRSAALRDSSARGLLERRKNRQSMHESSLGELKNLAVGIDAWLNPRSPSNVSADPSSSQDSAAPSRGSLELGRRGSYPRHSGRHSVPPSDLARSGTTVFDEGTPDFRSGSAQLAIPPNALPTPPQSQKNPASAHSILPSTSSSLYESGHDESESLIADASRRFHDFLVREAQAEADLERLQLFVDFVATESTLRMQRYPDPFLHGTFDCEAARQRLFRADLESDPAPGTFYESPSSPSERAEAPWWKDFRPALSPIASMSNDEMSSRGRTASRWWQSQTASDIDGAAKSVVTRSKRESKYMGLTSLLADEVRSEVATPTNVAEGEMHGTGYPPEKHHRDSVGVDGGSGQASLTRYPTTPDLLTPARLDISRFITLPPPYPRHYPAVNNNHPKLAGYRQLVRTLSDTNDLQQRRSRYNVSVDALRSEHNRKMTEGQQAFRVNVSAQIEEGSITYAEAAEAEHALRLDQHQAERTCLQAEFDTLQDVLINPTLDLFGARVKQLDLRIAELLEELRGEMRSQDLDRPQQEGDATPETLEYLTQLKWLFETRETMHKEVFQALSERNEKYKAIVLLPYHQNTSLDKLRDTEHFFACDGRDRRKHFSEAALARYRDFAQTVEDIVTQEVELQSSAFWDIAPGLLDLSQTLPDELDLAEPLAIPDPEYEENPAYHQFPQQYLYSLLDHAEKSTYQFIESQINLHCLLHEVKGSLIGAQFRATQAARNRDEPDDAAAADDLDTWRAEQNTSATVALKQQVTMIEEQWLEALGGALQGKKLQVKTFLENVGGWDESVQGQEVM